MFGNLSVQIPILFLVFFKREIAKDDNLTYVKLLGRLVISPLIAVYKNLKMYQTVNY